jgi:hypothetical protein
LYFFIKKFEKVSMRATVQNKKGMYAAQHEKKEVCMRRIPAQHVGNTPEPEEKKE